MTKRKDDEKRQPQRLSKRRRVELNSRARGELLVRATRCAHTDRDFDLWIDPKVVRAVSHGTDRSGRHEILRLHGQHTQYFYAEKFDTSEIDLAWKDMGAVWANPRFRMGCVVRIDEDEEGGSYVCSVIDAPNEDDIKD